MSKNEDEDKDEDRKESESKIQKQSLRRIIKSFQLREEGMEFNQLINNQVKEL